MSISQRLFPALAGFIAIVLTACGGSSSGGSSSSSSSSGGDSGGAIDPLLTAPTISAPAENQSVVKGDAATFIVLATGSALTYQWKKNGTDISGATSSNYTTPATSSADNGAVFSVSVRNGAGSVSSTATLTVSDVAVAPTISIQPADQTAITGQTVTFQVNAGGTSINYQWKKNGVNITGATFSSYTTPATSSADNGAAYSVSVSNSVGTVTSNNATLAVTEEVVVKPVVVAPAIDAQPAAQTVTAGQTARFSVTATGTSPSYQWRKNGTDVPGANASTYTTEATSDADIGTALAYSVVVSNSAGTVTSDDATLTVLPAAPAITAQPRSRTITAGQMATFSVTATGTGPLIYQWKKGDTDIPGATSSDYTTPAMSYAGNGALYSVEVSNSAGKATSSSATLTVGKTSTPKSYGLVANASDGLYDATECVQDNNTGLVWEGKTATGTRATNLSYSNYDDLNSAQKWYSASYYNPTQADIDDSTNSIGYKNAVNTSALCGFTDWRLPTKEELHGILASSGSPRIDTTWFPNTQSSSYWSSSPYMGDPAYATDAGNAWFVSFNSTYNPVFYGGRNAYSRVRLVR